MDEAVTTVAVPIATGASKPHKPKAKKKSAARKPKAKKVKKPKASKSASRKPAKKKPKAKKVKRPAKTTKAKKSRPVVRTERLDFRLTPAEKKKILAAVKRTGKTVTELFVSAVAKVK